MDTILLERFLRHLVSCTNAVLEQEEIDSDDIFRIRRELMEFKRHIDGKEMIDPVILDAILGLELHVDEALVGDSYRREYQRGDLSSLRGTKGRFRDEATNRCLAGHRVDWSLFRRRGVGSRRWSR